MANSAILDDFSRYIIAWKLCTTMKAKDVTTHWNWPPMPTPSLGGQLIFADDIEPTRLRISSIGATGT